MGGLLRPVNTVMSEAAAQRRKRATDEARHRCLELLAQVAVKFLMFSPVVTRVVEEEGEVTALSPSLRAVTAVKSTSTLLRRASSIRLYRAWFDTSGFSVNAFFTEPAAYSYFRFLYDDRSPATRAAGMHQAFLFLGGLFELPLEVFLRSSRLRGLTVLELKTLTCVQSCHRCVEARGG